MMRSAFTMAFVIAVAGVSVAQPGSAPIAKHDFEGSDHGWQAMGATGRVSITGVAANVKSGKGTLKFEYLVGPGEMSALMLPVSDAPPKGLKSIRFWVKSPVSMPLFVVLQERGGGRYQAQVAVPADRWQRVELSLSDFALSKEKDDPADPNNKLDVDQLEAVAIADLAQMLAGGVEPELLDMLGIKTGAREFYLDDIEASAEALPDPVAAPGEILLDAFLRPHASWFATGSVKAEAFSGKPLEGRGMRLEYESEEGKIAAAMKAIPVGSLTKAGKLLLTLASDKPVSLMVQFEETSGGKYNSVVTLEGGKKVTSLALDLSAFTAAEDSHDDNGRLDKAQIKQLVIADLSFMEGGGGTNTIWMGPVRTSKTD